MRVLVAIEDEAFSSAITAYLVAHNWRPGTVFLLLHVTEPASLEDDVTTFYDDQTSKALDLDCNQSRSKLLDDYKEELLAKLGSSVSIELAVTIGHPASKIVDNANRWNADMIIMGCHGRRGVSRFILGSVSLSVATHANCSVVILHPSRLCLVDQEHPETNKRVSAEGGISPNACDRAYRTRAV